MSPDPDQSLSLPTGLTRCVVVGRLEDVPSTWMDRIRSERGSVEAVSHPIIAFAEALRHEVADRLRPSFGLARQESIAVVFAGGAHRDEFDSFAAAVRAHAPEVGVWLFEDGKARPVGPGRTADRSPIDPTHPPSLRLAGTAAEPPRLEQAPAAPVRPEEDASRPTLDPSVTPEEIEMLLRFFDADPDSRPGGDPEVRR